MAIVSSKQNSKPNRANIELQNAKRHQQYIDTSYMTLLDVPTVLCNYYPISRNRSTFSEGFKDNINEFDSGLKYSRIVDFILFGIPDNILNPSEKDDEVNIRQEITDLQSLVLPNTVQPTEGDKITLTSQNHIIVYTVTNVDRVTFQDRSFWSITYSVDTTITDIQELYSSVEREFTFILENVGTESTPLLLTKEYENISKLNEVYTYLNQLYMDAFYHKDMDSLVYKVYKEDMYNVDSLLYYSHLVDFQNDYGVLKYRNTDDLLLTCQSERGPRALIGYRNSLMYKVINRKLPLSPEQHVPTPLPESRVFKAVRSTTEENLLVDEDFLVYVGRYDYSINYSTEVKLRKNPYSRFRQETLPILVCSNVKENSFQTVDKYTIVNQLFKKVFDSYLDNSKDFVELLFRFSEYQLLELSFDDYICIPIILKLINLYKVSNNYNWFTDNLTS